MVQTLRLCPLLGNDEGSRWWRRPEGQKWSLNNKWCWRSEERKGYWWESLWMPEIHQYFGSNKCCNYTHQRGSGHTAVYWNPQCTDVGGGRGFIPGLGGSSKCFQFIQCAWQLAGVLFILKEGGWKGFWSPCGEVGPSCIGGGANGLA